MLTSITSSITKEILNTALSYPEFKQLTFDLVAQGKTTGPNQSESYLNYTRLNLVRMNRVEKTSKVSEAMVDLIQKIDQPQVWLLLTEAWCGDGSQTIPYIAKLADLNPLISLKIIFRDEHPAIMDQYLTEGARSIPKLIGFSADLEEELFTWGPRPKYLQDRLKAFKLDPQGVSSKEFSEGTYLWYARDRNKATEQELYEAISKINES